MKEYILETERLKLRKLTIDDAQNFFALNENPKVIEHTGDKAFRSMEEAQDLIQNYDQYAYRLGRWAVELKSTGEFIGWCGLKFNLGCGDVDLGFRLFEKFWNCGYATEAGYASLYYGFDQLSLYEIIGRANILNKASINVLRKIGMKTCSDHESNSDTMTVLIARKFQFDRKGAEYISIL